MTTLLLHRLREPPDPKLGAERALWRVATAARVLSGQLWVQTVKR